MVHRGGKKWLKKKYHFSLAWKNGRWAQKVSRHIDTQHLTLCNTVTSGCQSKKAECVWAKKTAFSGEVLKKGGNQSLFWSGFFVIFFC